MSENTESEFLTSGPWPKLTVKDFGPIKEGAVELRPLTVFAGPGNTGKSWLATLIYAIRNHAGSGRTIPDDRALDNFPEDPVAWSQSLHDDGVIHLTDGEERVLRSVLESGQEALQKEILRCFGLAEVRDLVRQQGTGAASVTFVDAPEPVSLLTHRRVTVSRQGGFSFDADAMRGEYRPSQECLSRFRNQAENILANVFVSQDSGNGPGKSDLRKLRSDLLALLADVHCSSSIHYLPANRAGIMQTHRAAGPVPIQGGSSSFSNNQSVSGVLDDVLRKLMGLGDHGSKNTATKDPSSDLATRLERDILGGKVEIKANKVGYPYLVYRSDELKHIQPFTNVSSMVSELAPVVLYLRHYVLPGDLLILEEPEAHLHPEMQVRLVREIAEWVRRGIRVLITTHSEWVLDQISNIVAAHEGEKEVGLRKQDVGMWLFKPDDRKAHGSSIREIEWIVNKGGYDSDFDDVARELHNNWVNFVAEVE